MREIINKSCHNDRLVFQSERRAAGLPSECATTGLMSESNSVTDSITPEAQEKVVMDTSTAVGTDMAMVTEGIPIVTTCSTCKTTGIDEIPTDSVCRCTGMTTETGSMKDMGTTNYCTCLDTMNEEKSSTTFGK